MKLKSRQERAEEIMACLAAAGEYLTKEYTMRVDPLGSVVTVLDNRRDAIVAYSSTKADFADSVAEFVYDYLV